MDETTTISTPITTDATYQAIGEYKNVKTLAFNLFYSSVVEALHLGEWEEISRLKAVRKEAQQELTPQSDNVELAQTCGDIKKMILDLTNDVLKSEDRSKVLNEAQSAINAACDVISLHGQVLHTDVDIIYFIPKDVEYIHKLAQHVTNMFAHSNPNSNIKRNYVVVPDREWAIINFLEPTDNVSCRYMGWRKNISGSNVFERRNVSKETADIYRTKTKIQLNNEFGLPSPVKDNNSN